MAHSPRWDISCLPLCAPRGCRGAKLVFCRGACWLWYICCLPFSVPSGLWCNFRLLMRRDTGRGGLTFEGLHEGLHLRLQPGKNLPMLRQHAGTVCRHITQHLTGRIIVICLTIVATRG